jgi:hypothetical protein
MAPPAPDGGTAEEGLDSLRYDRTGQPLDQPIVVEDIALEDTDSEIEGTTDEATAAPDTTATAAPEEPPTTGPPPAAPEETAAETSASPQVEQRDWRGAQPAAGLEYLFSLVRAPAVYEFRLRSRTPTQPVELNYATGAGSTSYCAGTDLL